MKLSVGHKEITAGLVMYLNSRGVTGFNPETVHADFSFKRGTKELECTLDEDVAAGSVAKADPKPSDVAPVTGTATSAPVSETAPVVAVAEPEAAVAEAVAVVEAAVVAAEPVAEVENLFQ